MYPDFSHKLMNARPWLPLAALALAGCVSGPNYERPAMELPEAWPENALTAQTSTPDLHEWWRQFGDPVLNDLVERALAESPDIRRQTARVEEFRARLGLARADRLPTLDAQAGATRERQSAAAFPVPGIDTSTTNVFSVTGLLGYEVDLWGRLSREREAASALLGESLHAREAVILGLLTDVVVTYIDLRAAEQLLRITEETVADRAEFLRLQRIRYDAGDIDELALQQARSEYESIRAELPARRQNLRVLEGALGLLVGLEPAALWETLALPEGDLGQLTPPGELPELLPAALLERRPDLRAAEAQLIAANAAIGVAKAARLPRLNLSALLGTAAGSADDLFTTSAETWSLGLTAAAPIWDFGRSRSRVETAEAVAAQAEATYRIAVRAAFHDVRNALILYESSHERARATDRLITALERTEEIARLRYEEGFIGSIELLDARRALLEARLGHTQAKRDHLAASATLFKALGGCLEGRMGPP